MKVLIGETWYSSKTAAAADVRTVLYRYPIGASVMADDAAFLFDVLLRHPEATTKVGCGVASFQVEQNLGSRGFWLTRTDGTRTDWSFLSCLTPPTHAQEVSAGFRTEVRDQIQAFKAKALDGANVTCPITGVALTQANAHVDHDPPFEELVAAFLGLMTIATITVEPTHDGVTETRLADRAIAQAWAAFHQDRAGLRLVSRQANLSVLRRGRRRGQLSLRTIESILRAHGHEQVDIEYTLWWIDQSRDYLRAHGEFDAPTED